MIQRFKKVGLSESEWYMGGWELAAILQSRWAESEILRFSLAGFQLD
jgi:hypothetical protein